MQVISASAKPSGAGQSNVKSPTSGSRSTGRAKWEKGTLTTGKDSLWRTGNAQAGRPGGYCQVKILLDKS